MRMLPTVGLTMLLATVAAPIATLEAAQARTSQGRPQPGGSAARDEGFRRGQRAGEEHGRRGQPFNFQIFADFRDGLFGYRQEFGDRNRYRAEFRIGFEQGYREGYGRFDVGRGRSPWGNDRGYVDRAADNGYQDGYKEGLNDGRHNHRNDPVAESRYRGGDHGYERWYGPREVYRVRYREAFRDGYERGYRDGWAWR